MLFPWRRNFSIRNRKFLGSRNFFKLFLQQLVHTFVKSGGDPLRDQIRERFQDKHALVKSGVRNDQTGTPKRLIAIKKDVQIDRAGGVGRASPAAELRFQGAQLFMQEVRRQCRLNLPNGIEVFILAARSSDRFGFINRGRPDHPNPARARERILGTVQKMPSIPEIGSSGHEHAYGWRIMHPRIFCADGFFQCGRGPLEDALPARSGRPENNLPRSVRNHCQA